MEEQNENREFSAEEITAAILLDATTKILTELRAINGKLDEINKGIGDVSRKLGKIQGDGMFNSLDYISQTLEDIQGNGIHWSLSDIFEKIQKISEDVSSINLGIE